jgi:protoporphyrinogen oxidase
MNDSAANRAPRVELPTRDQPAVVIGAGPAGLAAAYELARHNVPTVVVDQDLQVGGIARTVEYKGFRFDIGGHRFYTKVPEVQALWRHMLGQDFLTRPRLSRILYRHKFYDYPLKPLNVVRNLGVPSAVAMIFSYLSVKLRPVRPEVSFADWVTNRFGRRLYHAFFKTYTEKVWGIPCERITAEWAAQRIKGLSLRTATLNMLFPRRNRGKGAIKTLIDEFEYPRLGPGMMWERFADAVVQHGGSVRLGERAVTVRHRARHVESIDVQSSEGRHPQPVGQLIATMPIPQLVFALDPPAPPDVVAAARRLRHRDFLTVVLILDCRDVFPDNWIYIHDDSVRVGRIQNYKNWSPDMVPDPRYTCLGLEYFVNEGDDLWTKGDGELLELGARELGAMGLADPRLVVDGTVVRMPKAYPVYEAGYEQALAVVKDYLAEFENLQVVGRNGMHRYNNQDHSMLTGLLAARNLFGTRFDLWLVNADDEYLEGQATPSPLDAATRQVIREMSKTQPLVPGEIPTAADI